VWRELEALLADQSPGATRAFLTSLAASDSDAIAAHATNRLEDYIKLHGSPSATDGRDDASTIADIRAKLIDVDLINAELEDTDKADPQLLDVIARKSINVSGTDQSLREAREIIVEGCRDNYGRRSKIRASLADAISHDYIGHILYPPAPKN
jgi:hypothetical protein